MLYNSKKLSTFTYQSNKINNMKNLKKIKRGELKTIKGGRPPLGCNSWNPVAMCCRSWAPDYCGQTTCPDSPPPLC